ncbi:MAG: ATP-binding protein [Betaproteobacteria bacterium]
MLAAATAVPVLAFALIAAGALVQRENENLISAAKARNQATLAAVDTELRGAINTLQIVGASGVLLNDDLEAFHNYAVGVLKTQPDWLNIVLQDIDGRQLVNARFPWGAPLPAQTAEPRTFEAAVQTAQPVISGIVFAPLLNDKPGIGVRAPVVREGKVVYVLSAVLGVQSFQRLLVSQRMPAGWVSGIVDNEGRMIVRVPEVPPGQLASMDYLGQVKSAREGWYRGRTIEGHDTYTAFLRSGFTGWSIGYAIPADAILGGAVHAAWLMASGIAASLIAAVLIGLWLSRRIARPMSALADAASALATGGTMPPHVESAIDEVQRLSSALTSAGATIAARDAELRRSRDELHGQAAELREANLNKSRFLALLAHELRNPLAPLRNGLHILDRSNDPQVQAKTRAMMARQVGHMVRLIDDLLDISRIDRGQLELRREHVVVNDFVHSGVETAQPGIEQKQQQLLVHYSDARLVVDGDAVRLSQVVSNLLNNASKFSPAHGAIEITVASQGEEAVVTVKDNGMGFAHEDRARIFELFVQLDAGLTRSAGGLGIGLTIVKSLVGLHGGRVTAHSDGPGKGATFEIHLPLVPVPRAESGSKDSEPQPASPLRRAAVASAKA